MKDIAQYRRIWRSLDEVGVGAEPRNREFPAGAIVGNDEVDRRGFLKMLAAAIAAAGLEGCTRQPIEGIVPYVRQPENITPGEALYFATAMPLSGFGSGILVKSREGRPIKVDGNALHPSVLGGSSVWMQACLLDLYNADRSKSVLHSGKTSSYAQFLASLADALAEQKGKGGAGLRLLTGTVTSPTMAFQIRELLNKFPRARWHQWEPINWDNAFAGARMAFGESLATEYRFDRAAVIVSLESDFLYTHPERLRHTRQFSDARRVVAGHTRMNRLYVFESGPTVTGSMADHRIPFSHREIEAAARFLAHELGVGVERDDSLSNQTLSKLSIAARDLRDHRGESVVICGESLRPEFHALEQKINHALGNFGSTVQHRAPAQANAVNHVESLRQLVEDMQQGAVELLVILGGNPLQDAPSDFAFAEKLGLVRTAVHLSPYVNETSQACHWHIPQTHFLEGWSDCRSFNGTVTIMQPLIAPLFKGFSEHQLLGSMLNLQPMQSDYRIVREFWRQQNRWPDFENGWRAAVHDGLIAGSANAIKTPSMSSARAPTFETNGKEPLGLEAVFRPDPHLWDGRFARNEWLQETPKPLTKLVWDNAILISPKLAAREKLVTGDVIEIRVGNDTVAAPVLIVPGQAENSLALPLGGTSNFYRIRSSSGIWRAGGVTIRKTGARSELVSTQTHQEIHGQDRQINREGTFDEFVADPNFISRSVKSPPPEETLYNSSEFEYPLKWGMSIDLTTCIGCNACVIACNLENNIPVVGKKQVALHREMLWLRVDTYLSGDADHPRFIHQPVPCMHCENAPCEYVCPVGATLHDHEGLNLQVYNRCIGTRYCSNNCPYKVRRFNFLRYADYDSELTALRNNPEVTVRWRGVMEKCTYCVQRISAARIRAKEENRNIAEGEVKTACQEACPAGAIMFGKISDPNSNVSKLKKHPLDFSMLGELNTRPRTTYSAKMRNPNPEFEAA
jgi:MoCo/4Fe-4S cofactor protein with predicted Tat translocation signal